MAVKRTRKKKEEINEEVLKTGDVINTEEVVEPVKNDTVTVCANIPRDCIFEVLNNKGKIEKIRIHGNSNNLRGKEAGVLPVGAYGITVNVPIEAWEQIKRNFADDPRFKNGLIFATTAGKARKEAIERKNLRNGFEPIDPKKAKTEKFEDK
ncbi:MAG: hypothetical protein IKE94_16545 [Aeriscardovia sp.]|nr:hypothetical protein [Aeriscardovia sp.]